MNLWSLFGELLDGDSVCLIDVGGYKGEFTDNFMLNIDKVDDVFMYEPHQKSFDRLKEKYSKNQKINVVQLALNATVGEKDYYYYDDAGYNSSLLMPLASGFESTKVRTDTLDRESKQFSSNVKYVLKIDTQGNDLDVIVGGEEFITNKKPIIFCELIYVSLYQGQTFAEEIITFMAGLGYVLVRLEDIHETGNGMLAYADGLFVHQSEHFPSATNFELHKDEYCLNLERVCDERLALIELLDQECKRLRELG
jgi:FkbM family methyltransferase